ncbi:MAG: Protein phosphatase 2C 1 [Thelocarpon superellum]|nr:MAG: Protein phosphatase 2C 1 [Thelocarpon superellum]
MFGNSPSPTKDAESGGVANNAAHPDKPSVDVRAAIEGMGPSPQETSGGEKRAEKGENASGPRPADEGLPGGDKKRRSGKASSLLASAKNSLHFSGSSHHSSTDAQQSQSPLQKLGKKDPALAVPQGPQNNSAGESLPGARSTFRVGVTEDKNKKCRRTMEDTHSYLYNFLSTPAPQLNEAADDTPSSESNTSLASTSKVVETDNGYFAVFDGHAGTFAADWCGKKLHLILEEAIRKNPNTPIPELLDQTFTNVDQQLDKLPLKNSGCTAVIAVLRWEDRIPNRHSATGSTAIAPATVAAVKAASEERRPTSQLNPDLAIPPPSAKSTTQSMLLEVAARQRVLYTANVGDARIILCRHGKALRLSYDHKGSDDNEGKRVANAGGLILNNRVNGVLAVTRALGDAYMKDLVTGHPYTTETVIQPDIDEFIILACDGLWDVCSDQEAVDLVRHVQDPQLASKMLVDHALARFSTDNLSCMIVRFDNKAVQNTVERRSEPIGVEGDPATKKGGISETEAIVLDAKQKAGQTDGSGGGADAGEAAEDATADEIINKVTGERAGEPGPELAEPPPAFTSEGEATADEIKKAKDSE